MNSPIAVHGGAPARKSPLTPNDGRAPSASDSEPSVFAKHLRSAQQSAQDASETVDANVDGEASAAARTLTEGEAVAIDPGKDGDFEAAEFGDELAAAAEAADEVADAAPEDAESDSLPPEPTNEPAVSTDAWVMPVAVEPRTPTIRVGPEGESSQGNDAHSEGADGAEGTDGAELRSSRRRVVGTTNSPLTNGQGVGASANASAEATFVERGPAAAAVPRAALLPHELIDEWATRAANNRARFVVGHGDERISVLVALEKEGVRIVAEAAAAETAELLTRHADTLERALERRGRALIELTSEGPVAEGQSGAEEESADNNNRDNNNRDNNNRDIDSDPATSARRLTQIIA